MFADLNTLALAAPANASKIAGIVGRMAPGAVEALARAAAAVPRSRVGYSGLPLLASPIRNSRESVEGDAPARS